MSCNSGYQKENGKWVWISYDTGAGKRVKKIDEHDFKSFKVLRNQNFAIDNNSVFYVGNIIKDADPISFKLLEESDFSYSKDDMSVFLRCEKIIFANPNTFKLLDFPYSKDDKHIFSGTIPLELSQKEIEEFKVTKSDGMESIILLSHFIELNPEYKWLDTLGIDGVIDGIFGEGETKTRKFKGFKEVKR